MTQGRQPWSGSCVKDWQRNISPCRSLQAKCFHYFAVVVVIRYETNATARRALTFIVRVFVNDTIAITVWTSFYFHVATRAGGSGSCPLLGRLSKIGRGRTMAAPRLQREELR